MKFGIDMGHNAPPDVGASSKFGSEDKLTKEVGTLVISKLQALGYEVVSCNPSSASSVIDSLQKRVNTANNNKVDVYVSIHFNSFNSNANGTEVFAISDASRRIATPVLKSILELGFNNRQVKNGSHLFVLKNTQMPAILIECCFLDSEKDMKRLNTEAMANAIVKGLAGKLPDTKPSDVKQSDDRVLELQKNLNLLQIRDSNGRALKEDGLLGSATETALQRFNQMMAINAGGRAVSLTWKALDEVLSKPTLRPNHGEGAAVRYLEFRTGAPIDGVYDTRTVDAVRSFQRQQGLTIDGIVGDATWNKLLGNSSPALALKVLRETVLKQEPIDSALIADPHQKYQLQGGELLALHSWAEEGNHVKVAFLNETFNGLNTWYAFTDHIEIWEDGEPLQLDDGVTDEAPQVDQRQDRFQLPGFTSTFLLSAPIIPNGNFTWREALHNGERIPKTRADVENIIALATRLESVRDRLGGFPLTITSWYRPEPWNSRAGGAKYSRHKIGQAADIIRSGMTGRQMASRLQDWPGGMGIYRNYPNLLHLDIRPYRARWGGA